MRSFYHFIFVPFIKTPLVVGQIIQKIENKLITGVKICPGAEQQALEVAAAVIVYTYAKVLIKEVHHHIIQNVQRFEEAVVRKVWLPEVIVSLCGALTNNCSL